METYSEINMISVRLGKVSRLQIKLGGLFIDR